MNEERKDEHGNRDQDTTGVLMRLEPNDVLMGRGVPAIANQGNVRFRELIGQRFRDYAETSKRNEKDYIAREVAGTIQARGGRFVRKIDSGSLEARQLGVPEGSNAWIPVDDATAILKVKQALRGRSLREKADEPGRKRGHEDEDEDPVPRAVTRRSPDLHEIVADTLRRYQEQSANAQGEESSRNLHAVEPAPSSADPRIPTRAGVAAGSDGRDVRIHAASPMLSPHLQAALAMRAPDHLTAMSRAHALALQGASGLFRSRSGPMLQTNSAPSVSHQEDQVNKGLGILGDTAIQRLGQNEVRETAFRRSIASQEGKTTPWAGLGLGDHTVQRAARGEAKQSDASLSLEVSLVELCLLTAFCSFGLPIWVAASSDDGGNVERKPPAFAFTWKDVANLVVQEANDFRAGNKNMPSLPLIVPTLLSNYSRLSDMGTAAASTAFSYLQNPLHLAKVAVMLLEKLRVRGQTGNPAGDAPYDETSSRLRRDILERSPTVARGHGNEDEGNSKTNLDNSPVSRGHHAGVHETVTKKSSSPGTSILLQFLQNQVALWAASLNVDMTSDSSVSSHPIPYSSTDFIEQHPIRAQHDLVAPVASLDASTCNKMLIQMGCITRLRSMFQHSTTEHLLYLINANPSSSALNLGWSSSQPSLAAQAATSRAGNANSTYLLLRSVIENGLSKGLRQFSIPQDEVEKAQLFQNITQLTCSLHHEFQDMTVARILTDQGAKMKNIATAVTRASERGPGVGPADHEEDRANTHRIY